MRLDLNGMHHENQNTVSLDEDVAARQTGKPVRGVSFRDAVRDLQRTALLGIDHKPRRRTFAIRPTHMGH